MAEYEMQEMNCQTKTEAHTLSPPRTIRTKQVRTTLQRYCPKRVHLPEVTSKVCYRNWPMNWLTKWDKGKSVKLDGIGTFVPSLALRIDKERKPEKQIAPDEMQEAS